MFDQGQAAGVAVKWPMEIHGRWSTLAATASSWASESYAAAEQMGAAAASWTGLLSSYRDSETQEIVRTALDKAPEVTQEWAQVAGRASEVLQGFATEANGLQQRASALEGQASRLQARLLRSSLLSSGGGEGPSFEDDALRREIEIHNGDVMTLESRWQDLEQQTAAEIDSIAGGGGFQDQIPVVSSAGADTNSAAFDAAGGSAGMDRFGARGLLGAGSLGFAFHSAVNQMIRSGNDSGTDDAVETATELYETVTSDDVTGRDLSAFYDHLGDMDADDIEDFSEANPQINQYSMPLPTNEDQLKSWPTGADGAAWWETLEANGTQVAMATFLPLVTGNTNGVPYTARNVANRRSLTQLLDADDLQRNQRVRLESIEQSLKEGGGERVLLSLNMGQEPVSRGRGPGPAPTDPLAAVSVGNPDSADTTTFNVSGMGSGTDAMPSEVGNAQQLYNGSRRDTSNEHAVVAWIGYESPGLKTVFRDEHAVDGSWALAYALDGHRETMDAHREDGGTTVNVNAHSYGTNTAARALTHTTHPVDTYSMYGSAGIPEGVAQHASDLNVTTTDEGRPAVYATDASTDWLSDVGRSPGVRQDPTDTGFGAYVFSSDGMGHPPGYPVSGHYQNFAAAEEYGYLERDSQAFEALSLINDGRGDEVDEMTDATVEYYQDLFDRHVEEVANNPGRQVTAYRVELGGQSEQVDTRGEAVKLVNEYYADKDYCPAPEGP